MKFKVCQISLTVIIIESFGAVDSPSCPFSRWVLPSQCFTVKPCCPDALLHWQHSRSLLADYLLPCTTLFLFECGNIKPSSLNLRCHHDSPRPLKVPWCLLTCKWTDYSSCAVRKTWSDSQQWYPQTPSWTQTGLRASCDLVGLVFGNVVLGAFSLLDCTPSLETWFILITHTKIIVTLSTDLFIFSGPNSSRPGNRPDPGTPFLVSGSLQRPDYLSEAVWESRIGKRKSIVAWRKYASSWTTQRWPSPPKGWQRRRRRQECPYHGNQCTSALGWWAGRGPSFIYLVFVLASST